jgi:PhnB protein
MLGDACPERNSYGPSADVPPPISLYIYVKDVDATINQAAAAGANISRPAQDMFYGDRTGMITDPFGHQWCIATHFEDVSKAELKKRHAAMMQNFKNNPSIEVQQKFEDAELENTGEFERD